jgi:hypothetical protein
MEEKDFLKMPKQKTLLHLALLDDSPFYEDHSTQGFIQGIRLRYLEQDHK